MKIGVIVIAVLFVVFAGYFIFTKSSSRSSQPTISQSAQPTTPVTDYAPSVPLNQKTTIVIRLSDSSTQTYLVPKDQVDMFVSKLPEGEAVVSKTDNK